MDCKGSAQTGFASAAGSRRSKSLRWVIILSIVWFATSNLRAQMEERPIDDITAKYHFLSADDTLAILDQEGRLKGYVDIRQDEQESDEFLSYNIVEGTRKKLHVEFRTNKIHGRYYRFSGNVERGAGHKDGDPDYLRLIGDVEVVSVKSDTGQESKQVTRVVLKCFGKSERDDN